jgi:hypothetical protein
VFFELIPSGIALKIDLTTTEILWQTPFTSSGGASLFRVSHCLLSSCYQV